MTISFRNDDELAIVIQRTFEQMRSQPIVLDLFDTNPEARERAADFTAGYMIAVRDQVREQDRAAKALNRMNAQRQRQQRRSQGLKP